MDVIHRLAEATLSNDGSFNFFAAGGARTGSTFIERSDITGDRESLSSNDLIRQLGRALLVGAPGTGKTTLLKCVAQALARQFLAGDSGARCPLLFYGNEIAHYTFTSIIRAASRIATMQTGATLSGPFELALRRGEIVLLIDAIDEVPAADRSALLESLATVANEAPSLPVLLASRPEQFTTSIQGFELYELGPLSWSETSTLASRLFSE